MGESPFDLTIRVRGTVQGVGFRPFIFRLANDLGIKGWVKNDAEGVLILAQAPGDILTTFIDRIKSTAPAAAKIQELEVTRSAHEIDLSVFKILTSSPTAASTTSISPDLATCDDCLRELFQPGDRRYLYPFTNCTNCGPRYSIIEGLPYDRPNTTMKHFQMCNECAAEYGNPADRRFHAQPIACPVCGPQVALLDRDGTRVAQTTVAIRRTAELIKEGKIVAIKGIGGFQLLVDATSDTAVAALRKQKRRDEKPFALMVDGLATANTCAEVSPLERELLTSPAAPIVLLRATGKAWISAGVAPGNPYLGIMLPYSPLHHLLMQLLSCPVVATSGNISEEPICKGNEEALERLSSIAEFFLVHDRLIARHVDDSVVRVMGGKATVIRRARGFAPAPINAGRTLGDALAVGAHMKNSISISTENKIFTGAYIGDLDNTKAIEAFKESISSLSAVYKHSPIIVCADKHPDYVSTRYAKNCGLEVHHVQHHEAHIYSVMAEHNIKPPLLGVSWDGTGYGEDGTIWGGEFFVVDNFSTFRTARLKPFYLPGGDRCSREGVRVAISLLHQIEALELLPKLPLGKLISSEELEIYLQMLNRKINCPLSSSAGRLFDAVSALCGIRARSAFEGQAAMELEFAIKDPASGDSYSFEVLAGTSEFLGEIDWKKTVAEVCLDLTEHTPAAVVSAKYHNTLANIIVEVAKKAGQKQIALSGGCFQNRYLTEKTLFLLMKEGFVVYTNNLIPPNDNGISVGQLFSLALRRTPCA